MFYAFFVTGEEEVVHLESKHAMDSLPAFKAYHRSTAHVNDEVEVRVRVLHLGCPTYNTAPFVTSYT